MTAEASSWNSHDLSLSFEGPIVEDKLAARVTGRNFRRGGQYTNFTNPTSEKLGRQTTGAVSGSVVFTPTDSFKVKAFANWFEDNDGPPAQAALKASEFNGRPQADGSCASFATAPPGTAFGGQIANSRASFGYFCGTLPKVNDTIKRLISGDYDFSNLATRNAIFNPNRNFILFDPQFKQDGGIKRHAFQADIRMDYEHSSGYNFSSLSAYHRDKAMTILDLNYRDGHDRVNPNFTPATAATRVPWMQFIQVSQSKTRDWSQELRITSPQEDPLRFTLGGNYLDAHTPGGPVYGISQNGPNFSSSITAGDINTPAVFGAAYYDFTSALTLSLEARYQWDKIKSTPKIGITGAPVPAPVPIFQDTFKSFSPRVSLDYKYAEGSTAYALFSRGYRPGGFNTGLATICPGVNLALNPAATCPALDALRAVVPNAGLSFDQEKVDNYEIGLKSTWLDGRARTVLTAYYDEWIGGQVANSIPVSIPATPTSPAVTNLIPLTVNNGKAELKGIEFEGQIQATEELKLSGTFGLNDTEIKTYGAGIGQCSDCNNIYGSFGGAIGNRLPTTPKYTWTLSAEYTDEFTADYDWYSRVDYQHQGSKFTDFSNVAKVGTRDVLNARIGVRNETMSIEAFVTNLTNDKTMLSALLGVDVFTFIIPPNKNEIRFSPPLPRAVGVRASYNF
ncbi:MAG: TonB-dependent receptor [Rhodospirillaceae bacterium]|nr:TonB-dependent receptor [Rhodospirillaceae bacterium]